MIYLALGVFLLSALYGGGKRGATGLQRLAAGLRGVVRVWRPTAGLGSAVLLVLALALAVREDWLIALPVGIAGLALAMGARRRGAPRPSAPASPTMSRHDASAILGVGPAATAEEVQAAYRRLIRTVHPDGGGTRGLAAQLNAARETLVGKPARER